MHEVEVFFDGDCPLCLKEIQLLRKLDRKGRIAFTDIAADNFDPSDIGISYETLMEEIHARLADGQWITGVEVFRRLYGAVGFGAVMQLTRLPGVSHTLDFAYEKFAKNRLKLTGRCDDSGVCETKPA